MGRAVLHHAFLVFGIWWANRRRDVPGTSAELLIPVRVSRVIAVLSGLSVLIAVFLFLFPGRAAAIWPWTLTPLTARVIWAIFRVRDRGAWVPRPVAGGAAPGSCFKSLP